MTKTLLVVVGGTTQYKPGDLFSTGCQNKETDILYINLLTQYSQLWFALEGNLNCPFQIMEKIYSSGDFNLSSEAGKMKILYPDFPNNFSCNNKEKELNEFKKFYKDYLQDDFSRIINQYGESLDFFKKNIIEGFEDLNQINLFAEFSNEIIQSITSRKRYEKINFVAHSRGCPLASIIIEKFLKTIPDQKENPPILSSVILLDPVLYTHVSKNEKRNELKNKINKLTIDFMSEKNRKFDLLFVIKGTKSAKSIIPAFDFQEYHSYLEEALKENISIRKNVSMIIANMPHEGMLSKVLIPNINYNIERSIKYYNGTWEAAIREYADELESAEALDYKEETIKKHITDIISMNNNFKENDHLYCSIILNNLLLIHNENRINLTNSQSRYNISKRFNELNKKSV